MSSAESAPKSISDIFQTPEGKRQFRPTTEQRLQQLEADLLETSGAGLIDFVRMKLEGGSFVRELAAELSITNYLLEKVCDLSGIQRPTRADATRMRWERGSLSRDEARVRIKTRMEEDGEFRTKALDALSAAREKQKTDPDHAERLRQRSLQWWLNPEYRAARQTQARERWDDSEFREMMTEVSRRTMQRNLQNPEFKAKQAAGAGEATRRRWQDPQQRAEMIRKLSEANQRRMADPDIASKVVQLHRELAIRQWEENREFMTERVGARWEDEDFRRRHADAVREAANRPERIEEQRRVTTERWQDPQYREKMKQVLKPPTIYGARADLDFVALSAWEANIARVLMYVGRDFLPHEQLSLIVPEEYRNVIKSEITTFDIDFLTVTPRGNVVLYEIMAHPLEDPEGWAKLELASQQHGGLDIRPVLPRFYNLLEDRFQDKINADQKFRGWETGKDNLRMNPVKFTPVNNL